jgi:hypothetical protein
MKMTWDIIYISIVTITLIITYIICIVRILKNRRTIQNKFKPTYYIIFSYSIYEILITLFLKNSIFFSNLKNIFHISLEVSFLSSIFILIDKAYNKIIYFLSSFIILTHIYIHYFSNFKVIRKQEIDYYDTIIYFLYSLVTLYFIKIYFKKTSSILNVISIKNDPLHILMIGIFFGYGLSLPIDAIYSYLILFEKPFFLQMVAENFKIFRVIKFSELVCFIILNIYIINSLKCFKPV